MVIRICEILVALVFLVAAFLKALDMAAFAQQIKYYGIFADPELVRLSAYGSLTAEMAAGLLLLSGLRLRGITYGATAALLIGFSGLVAWAWAYHGLEDCGCFGKYIKLGPAETLAKNGVTLGVVGLAWGLAALRGFPRTGEPVLLRWGVALLAVAVVGGTAAFAGPAAPPPREEGEALFAKYEAGEHSLAQGRYLVAMLSATCDHCADAVPVLNDAQAVEPGVPVVALMLGDAESVDAFKEIYAPEFPVAKIEAIDFFERIGREPPRFYYVEDGVAIRHLDTLEVTLEELIELIGSAPSPAPPA